MKKNKLLLFIILIFPYIEPLSFKDIPLLDKVYSAMKILWFFIICLIYFLNLIRLFIVYRFHHNLAQLVYNIFL